MLHTQQTLHSHDIFVILVDIYHKITLILVHKITLILVHKITLMLVYCQMFFTADSVHK